MSRKGEAAGPEPAHGFDGVGTIQEDSTAARLLKAALEYAARGWAVLPVWGILSAEGGLVCACRHGADCRQNPGKHPRTRHGWKDATPAPERIRKWNWAGSNLAIATGRASGGLIVLDVDPRHDGRETLKRLQRELGELPLCPTVSTGGGGWHLYLRYPPDEGIGCPQAGPGLDIRADGGYALAPPSRHISGGMYTWRIPPEKMPPPELPKAWREFLKSPPFRKDLEKHKLTQANTGERKLTQANTGETQAMGVGVVGRWVQHSTPPTPPDAENLLGTLPQDVRQAVLAHLPPAPGNRNRALFELARALKGLPRFAGAEFSAVEHVFRTWHALALERGLTDTIPTETTLGEAGYAWQRIRHPKGTLLDAAAKEAHAVRLSPACAELSKGAAMILRIGAVLGRSKQGTFFLSTRACGRLLGIPHAAAWQLLRHLVAKGFLQVVEVGTAGDSVRRASTYRLCEGVAELPADAAERGRA